MKNILRFSLFLIVTLSACAPASTPVPTSTSADLVLPYVVVVDNFYRTINEAQMEEDLFAAYKLLATQAMCNQHIFASCESTTFQTRWWKWKAAYKLYDCGDNVVIAEETRYPRDDNSLASSNPRFLRFKLTQIEDSLLISDVSFTPSSGDGCILVVDRSEMP